MSENYILNGGFEEGSLHWDFIDSSIVSIEKYGGQYCALVDDIIYQAASVPGEILGYFCFRYKAVDLTNPVFRAKAPGMTLWRRIDLSWEISSGDAQIIYDKNLGNGWREILVSVMPSGSPESTQFCNVAKYGYENGGSYYIDDVYWGLTPPNGNDESPNGNGETIFDTIWARFQELSEQLGLPVPPKPSLPPLPFES